jgi:hypothetical protein
VVPFGALSMLAVPLGVFTLIAVVASRVVRSIHSTPA